MASRAFQLNVPAANGSGDVLDLSRFGDLAWQVQGTGWDATLQLEGRKRGGTFEPIGVSSDSTMIGAIDVIPGRVEEIRVTVSSYVSGAPAARIHGDLNSVYAPELAPPYVIPGAKWWVRSDTLVVPDAGRVSYWPSKLGGHVGTATGAARPTMMASGVGGQPTVRFDGVANVISYPHSPELSASAADCFQVFAVATWQGASKFGELLAKTGDATGNNWRCFRVISDALAIYWGTNAQSYPFSNVTVPAGSTVVQRWEQDAVAAELEFETDTGIHRFATTMQGTGSSTTPLLLGGMAPLHPEVDVSEIVFFKRATPLTTSEKDSMIAYLTQRYSQ